MGSFNKAILEWAFRASVEPHLYQIRMYLMFQVLQVTQLGWV